MKKTSSALRLLFITRAYPPAIGGMQRFAADFYNRCSQWAEVQLIANSRGNRMLLPFLLKAVLSISLGWRRWDVVHLYDGMLAPLIPLIKALSRAKVSVTVNGLDIVFPRFAYDRIVSFFLKRADQVFAISEQTKEACLARGVPAEKLMVIPVGISPGNEERCSEAARTSLASRFGIPGAGKRILLTVGRLVKRKGHAWFISEVLVKLPDEYEYVIAGTGPEQKTIARRAQEVGLSHRVHFLGVVSEADKQCLYQMAHVFVMPNIAVRGDQEGFGIVALEAGLMALPVIASDIEGIRDAVINGKTGVLIKPGNVQAFLEAIVSPGLDPAIIRKAVVSRFDWNRISEMYADAFRKLLQVKGNAPS